MADVHNEVVEVDPAVLANDKEDYESSGYDTSTQSLSSTINEYIFENGRRYHSYFGANKNPLPTDETEQDRLDLHHEILLEMLEGDLYKAPIENPQRILDIGTGTGIWAIDMADRFPSAEVIGTDLSPIQPKWVPPNCLFEVDDAEQDWTFKSDSFDFIHVRNLSQALSQWTKVMSDIYRCTKSGGYVELAELGGELYSDDNTLGPNLVQVFQLLNREAMPKIGRPAATDTLLKERLEKAGFVDITVHKYKHIIGPWPKNPRQKKIGAMNLLNMETGIEAYVMYAATRILQKDPEEAKVLCRKGFADVKNKNYHAYNWFYVVHARKPMRKGN